MEIPRLASLARNDRWGCPIRSGMTVRTRSPIGVGDDDGDWYDDFISLPPAKRGDRREVFSI